MSKIIHGDKEIICAPYKIAKENDTDKKIIEQNNFSNASLICIGTQLKKMESILKNKQVEEKEEVKPKIKSHVFKSYQVSSSSQKELKNSKNEFLQSLKDQLSRI